MNKLKLILNFLFLIGLMQDNIIFAAAKTKDTSSSSSSTSKETMPYMSSASIRQKKAAQEISNVEAFKHFPPGLIPLVMQYEDYNEDATRELLKALENRYMSDEQRLIDVRQALKNGANPNNPTNPNDFDNSPLKSAIITNANYEIFKALIDEGANVNTYATTGKNTYTPLRRLIDRISNNKDNIKHVKELVKIFRLLLENEADPNVKFVQEMTTLIYAIMSSLPKTIESEIIKLLLHAGANPLLGKTSNNKTFFDIADEQAEVKKAYEEYLQEKAKKEASSIGSSSSSSSSKIPKARAAEPFNYPGSPAPAPKDDKIQLTISQLRFLWDNVTPEQRKAWEDAGGPDVDPRTIKEIGKATVRIILG